ncbi:MAG TPA: hypothetical protein VFV27_00715 [Nevskiaceae bacterium]|nr:hypothetical protein [Nevskiaceae bacterium]
MPALRPLIPTAALLLLCLGLGACASNPPDRADADAKADRAAAERTEAEADRLRRERQLEEARRREEQSQPFGSLVNPIPVPLPGGVIR